MRLNLGCGSDIMPGFVNVDITRTADEVTVWDLDCAPWPFDAATCESVVAIDVFEHVDKPLTFMNEAWRVLSPGGTLFMQTPHYDAEHAFTDPTHRRFPTRFTWDYWVPGTILHKHHHAAYGPAEFERVSLTVESGTIRIVLRKEAQ